MHKSVNSRIANQASNPPSGLKLRNLRLLVWRWRHLFVALAAAVVVSGFARLIAETADPPIAVLVAARPIQIGSTITAADIVVAEFPIAGADVWIATLPDDVIGTTALGFLDSGAPIWRDLVSTNELGRLAPAGKVIVAVQLDHAVAGLLAPGDRVDLVEPSAESPTFLARSALVLPPRSVAGGGSGLLGIGTGSGQVATIVAVSPNEAPGLAVAARTGQVSAILVG